MPGHTMIASPTCRVALVLLALIPVLAAETPIPLPNPGFEENSLGWSCSDQGMSRILPEAARSGEAGLRVHDADASRGSSLRSERLTALPNRAYALRFWGRPLESSGVAVYLQFLDAEGRMLTTPARRNESLFDIPAGTPEWTQYTLAAKAPPEAAGLRVWIHSFNGAKATADIDDLTLTLLDEEEEAMVKTTPRTTQKPQTTFPVPSGERIAQIAAMLTAQPAGLGDPAHRRDAWNRLAILPKAETVIQAAEHLINTPTPELPDELYLQFTRNGNRTNYQRPYGQRTSRLSTLLIAECLEFSGRFIPSIEGEIRAICEERSWVMPAHDASLSNFNGTELTVDLGSSARALLLASADWWLQHALSPAVREQLRAEVRRRVIDPYLQTLRSGTISRGFWWMRGTNNWNAVCNANVVGTALALVDARDERAEVVAGAEQSLPFFFAGFTDDGYCSEGIGYWNYGFGHFMMLAETVLAATGGELSFYQDPKLPHIAAYPRNIMIDDTIAPAFADCSVGARPAETVLALIQRRFPEALRRPVVIRNPIGTTCSTIAFFGFADSAPNSAPDSRPDKPQPRRSWFGDAGILVSRATADSPTPSFGAAIKGGHNAEHHNHNDVGSFVIACKGHAYLLDPGGEEYTRRTFSAERYTSKVLNSFGHPVPVVAGTLQTGGRAAAAKILQTEFSDVADRLVLDLSAAYAVPELTSLVRTFVHDRSTQTITVEDQVRFSEPQAFATALVTLDRVFQRNDSTFVIYDSAGSLVVQVEVDGAPWTWASETIENPNRPTPTRLGITLSEPVSAARVRLIIQPAPVAADLPGIYRAPEIGPGFQPLPDEASVVQADAIADQVGGEVVICEKPGAQGKAIKFWDRKGHALSWTFQVPREADYAIQIRYCQAAREAVSRTILLDKSPLGSQDGQVMIPTTPGWSNATDDWNTIWIAQKGKALTRRLEPGTHTITMINDCGAGVNLDWIALVPLKP